MASPVPSYNFNYSTQHQQLKPSTPTQTQKKDSEKENISPLASKKDKAKSPSNQKTEAKTAQLSNNLNLQTQAPKTQPLPPTLKNVKTSPSKTTAKTSHLSSSNLSSKTQGPSSLFSTKRTPGKEPLHSKTTKRRKVLTHNSNLTASVKNGKAEFSDEMLMQHGADRIVTFFLQASLTWKKALKTDGSKLPIKVWVDGARYQGGRAKDGFHAAHCNAASGLSDNLRETLIDDTHKVGITPKKRKTLQAMGFTDSQLDEMNTHHADRPFIEKEFNSTWPDKRGLISSIYRLDFTICAPSQVNWEVDGFAERNKRGEIAKLITESMLGEKEPVAATKEFVAIIRECFEDKIKELKDKINSAKANGVGGNELNKLKKLKHYFKIELKGTVEPAYELLIGKFDQLTKTLIPLEGEELLTFSFEMLTNLTREGKELPSKRKLFDS